MRSPVSNLMISLGTGKIGTTETGTGSQTEGIGIRIGTVVVVIATNTGTAVTVAVIVVAAIAVTAIVTRIGRVMLNLWTVIVADLVIRSMNMIGLRDTSETSMAIGKKAMTMVILRNGMINLNMETVSGLTRNVIGEAMITIIVKMIKTGMNFKTVIMIVMMRWRTIAMNH